MSRGARRKIAAGFRDRGEDWRTLYYTVDATVKQLSADLARVRGREATKDADLARLRTDCMLLCERLDAKTRAHAELAAAFTNFVQHAQTGQTDVGVIIGIVAA